MKTNNRVSVWLAAAFLIVLLVSLSSGGIQAQGPDQPPGPEGSPDMGPSGSGVSQALLGHEIPGLQVSYHAETGKVRFLSTEPGYAIPRAEGLREDASPEAAARGFLSAYGSLFGLRDQAEELTVMRQSSTDDGRSFVRFQQVYQGIPVMAGELIVQVNAEGEVLSANGEILPDLDLEATARIPAEAAQETGIQATAKAYEVDAATLEANQPELWVFSQALLGGLGRRTSSLVWRMEVTSQERLDLRELVLVDAQDGSIRLHFNQVDAAKFRLIYDNQNNPAFGLPGIGPVRIEGMPPMGALDVDNAYDYSGFTYDFYWITHGRDSLDDAGLSLVQTVRYCPNSTNCPYQNAFWDGVQMVYGEGYSSADDVVGHEMTHGVTDYESNLFYYMQSGAISESFSDIWGEFIDLTYTNGLDDDSSGVRWLMGEDLPGGAIRSMSNPLAYGDPDRMTSTDYYCGTNDRGGVHINSGVGNKAASLMVDGGTFNGHTVTGIGITKTAKIFYDAQRYLMTSGSDYQDLHDTLHLSCQNLIGTAGITSWDCSQVAEALMAAEMNQQPTSCAVPHTPLCDTSSLRSSFNGSAEGWAQIAGSWSTASGTYFETNGVPDAFSSISANNPFSSFDFQVTMRRLGCESCANAILVQGSPYPLGYQSRWYKAYYFAYTNNGYFSVFEWNTGVDITHKGWTVSGAINPHGWNTLRVVGMGSNYHFYINGHLVWSITDGSLTSGAVGVMMYRDLASAGNVLQVDSASLTGGNPSYQFYDDFEGGLGQWTTGALIGSNAWSQETGYATSGIYDLYGEDQSSVTDMYAAMNSDVTLPAGRVSFLRFNHNTDFESSFDGGVIEYSTDGGAGWLDAGSLILEQGYNGTMSNRYGNPLGGRRGYVYESHGFRSSRLNLGALAGKNVRFRFRLGTDSSIRNLGWDIDDVSIYYCMPSNLQRRNYLPLAMLTFTPAGFDAQFNDDSLGWESEFGPWYGNSAYFYSTDFGGSGVSASYPTSYSSLDYQVTMRRTGGSESNRLWVRGTPDPLVDANWWNSAYAFQYATDGEYSVWKFVSGVDTALQGWTASPAIVTGTNWNTLRVVASGGQLRFYINGSLVWSGTDYSLSQGRVGFGMYTSSASDMLEIDWATLTPSVPPLSADTISAEQQALNQAAKGQAESNSDGVP